MATAKKTVSQTIWCMVSVSADSVALSPRTAAVMLPYMTALAMANRAPTPKLPAPGAATKTTPAKPTASAAPRARPMRSFSQSAAASAAQIGAEKLIATTPASGISASATMNRLCAVPCATLRPRWAAKRCVRNTGNPTRGRISAAQMTSEPKERKNSTSAKE